MQQGDFDDDELQPNRCAFARQMTTIAGVSENARLEEALAFVKREAFLGSDLG